MYEEIVLSVLGFYGLWLLRLDRKITRIEVLVNNTNSRFTGKTLNISNVYKEGDRHGNSR